MNVKKKESRINRSWRQTMETIKFEGSELFRNKTACKSLLRSISNHIADNVIELDDPRRIMLELKIVPKSDVEGDIFVIDVAEVETLK